jgi:hypothetical protein
MPSRGITPVWGTVIVSSFSDPWFLVEAIEKAVTEVSRFDADEWFVIAISDANFGRYQITAADLKRSLYHDPKVYILRRSLI